MTSEKGFFTFAQNSIRSVNGKTIEIDYARHAYALALSIKTSQKEITNISVAITPGQKIEDRHKLVFDEIIEIPWGDAALNHEYKFQNEYKVFHLTPYDKTIKIEADMLLTEDISDWWHFLNDEELIFTTKVFDYRANEITSIKCRKFFDNNKLPNIYNGLMYFNKHFQNTKYFFAMAQAILLEWKTFSYEFLDYTRPIVSDTDTVYALALKLSNLEDKIVNSKPYDIPSFIHMKNELMNWDAVNKSASWQNNVQVFFTDDLKFKIGNYEIFLPFHYHEKNFLTDNIIHTYEKVLGI